MRTASQTSATNTDVLIVGGGPAGLAAAIELGRQRLNVTVIERRVWPVDKVCGEGLMPTGVDCLKRLGVFKHIEPDQLRPFAGITWLEGESQAVQADFIGGPGFGIRRLGLSRALSRPLS